jgi:hypothetical protein
MLVRVSAHRDHRKRRMAIAENGASRSPKTAMAIAENDEPITENGDGDHSSDRSWRMPPGATVTTTG